MLSLLYVSRSCLDAENAEQQLMQILEVAVARNLAAGVTGALVYSGSDFAQVLEGPEDAVAQIMASILIDPRHDAVRIVRRDNVETRSFPNWGMALIGHVPQTQQQIDALWDAADDDAHAEAIEGLVQWMRQGTSAQI